MAKNEDESGDLEWEEWDGQSPFVYHCLAGSIAGVAEHTILYPVDTVKTHMQSYCADCSVARQQQQHQHVPKKDMIVSSSVKGDVSTAKGGGGGVSGSAWMKRPLMMAAGESNGAAALTTATTAPQETMLSTARHIMNSEALTQRHQQQQQQGGYVRLWRGVRAMAVGCIPAHALYFSSYEAIKALFANSSNSSSSQHMGMVGSSVAGATATFFHDAVMTPLDTIKQRLQLGHYAGARSAFQEIVRTEGLAALYRSFPITLLTNLPHGAMVVCTNEFLRSLLCRDGRPMDVGTTLAAGSGAGAVAAAVTAPLDRVKTRLQTQRLGATPAPPATPSSSSVLPKQTMTQGVSSSSTTCPQLQNRSTIIMMVHTNNATAAANCPKQAMLPPPKYDGLVDAFQSIVREEGWRGLFRGVTPRVLTHAPSVAISWTTYEMAKQWLVMSPAHS